MAEAEKKQSFWTTMPGILTGVAALLTAFTGLLVVVHPRSGGSPNDKTVSTPGAAAGAAEPLSSAPVAGSAAGAAEPLPTAPAAASSPSKSTPPAAATKKGYVSLTSRTGEVTQLAVATFAHGFTGKSIELTNGQTIMFEKIKVIDFLDQNRDQQVSNVKVTLTDGRVVPGTLRTGYLLEGESDIGPFKIWLPDVKQIAFPAQ